MWQVKNVVHKCAMRSLLLAGTTTLLASLALVPTVSAQIAISINPPVCSYGYYEYAPYGCAPMGFYGPGYFYNGIGGYPLNSPSPHRLWFAFRLPEVRVNYPVMGNRIDGHSLLRQAQEKFASTL